MRDLAATVVEARRRHPDLDLPENVMRETDCPSIFLRMPRRFANEIFLFPIIERAFRGYSHNFILSEKDVTDQRERITALLPGRHEVFWLEVENIAATALGPTETVSPVSLKEVC